MDYLKIVLDGYLNPSTREHLTDYFFREFKKAEKEYFNPKEFFESGCLQIVEAFKYDIQNKITEEQLKVYKMIEVANSGKLKYKDLNLEQMQDPKLVQVEKEKFLEDCNSRLSGLSESSFYVFLTGITNGRFLGHLSWESIEYIEYSILAALEKILSEKSESEKEHQPKQISKGKEKLIDLITHKNSIEIVESMKTQYKNIKGKRLKLLLLALQELSLLPKERIAQKFYDCCKAEFDWYIASYPAMNDYKFNAVIDKNELEEMKKHIEPLLK